MSVKCAQILCDISQKAWLISEMNKDNCVYFTYLLFIG